MSTQNSENPSTNRRSFLGFLGATFLSLTALVMGFAGSLYSILPAFSKSKKDTLWQNLTPLDKLPNGISKHSLTINAQTGWANSQTEKIVWVVKENQSLNVFSAVCPHQGCIVNQQANEFICHCHMSKWKMDGVKSQGPTPRDLDKLDHRINNNNLEINYQNFKIGVSEKTPLA
ncbi:MAG: Rieske 2Fe-2S domain-containing protein [Acidobacteria bacterium]|nr:Rieske 2Fe-2S domain-containing protein [Acidobacteriota bacterium]